MFAPFVWASIHTWTPHMFHSLSRSSHPSYVLAWLICLLFLPACSSLLSFSSSSSLHALCSFYPGEASMEPDVRFGTKEADLIATPKIVPLHKSDMNLRMVRHIPIVNARFSIGTFDVINTARRHEKRSNNRSSQAESSHVKSSISSRLALSTVRRSTAVVGTFKTSGKREQP